MELKLGEMTKYLTKHIKINELHNGLEIYPYTAYLLLIQ